ncbi:NAD(+) synthase [Haloarcula litorea]|uniref:NAD(+) synthase n=1 Tax=Haloarcula litorea TaxID=3032579 RepID=UPI0023E86060|nr:NAD(+) synthase [Halomicroarcula sp. GDY20]
MTDHGRRTFAGELPRTDFPATATVVDRIGSFIRDRVAAADASGVVVAMSGGLDSTVSAALAADALGADRVFGLALPCHKTDATAAAEAGALAESLGIEFERVHLRPLVHQFRQTVVPALAADDGGPAPTVDRAVGNAVARFRTVCTYYAANRRDRLVLGTANRSERLLGYVTKHGDAADLQPLGDLYKTEVREVADYLGVPEEVVEAPPSAGRSPGQTDADDLGATYDVVDPFLRRVVDDRVPVDAALDGLALDRETAGRLHAMCRATAHKRAVAPTPGVVDRPSRPFAPE